MKRFNLSYINIIFTLFLAFCVMEFINLLVGSVGGLPVMAGFLVAYYITRYRIFGQRDNVHIVKGMAIYVGSYAAVWFIGTVVLFMSKYSGWGNIKKLNFSEYFKGLYGATLSEVWEYIFAIILMFTVIVSLFPLNIIRNRKTYVRYLSCNGVIWSIILLVLELINKKLINHKSMLQAGCLMAVAVVLGIAETICIFLLVRNRYRNIDQGTKDRIHRLRVRRRGIKAVIFIIAFVAVVGIFTVTYFMSPSGKPAEYDKVASCLTEDRVMGPVVYNEQVYIPIALDMDYDETGIPLGYIVYKNQDYDSRYYELAGANLLYMNKNGDDTYLQMAGNDSNFYKKLSVLEKTSSWKDDKVFLMWDEEWQKESAYGKDVTGFSECGKELVKSLESTFGEVEINPDDFKDYDAYFTISGYRSMKDAIEYDNHTGTWVGCILVKDDRFYYGNYDNEITGGLLQKLRHVIGGNS